jgi:hypothetical protein
MGYMEKPNPKFNGLMIFARNALAPGPGIA